MKLFKKLFIKGILTCETGLHIGAGKDTAEIGGVDMPVVRRKDNGEPYIPGSSLKGKMRCLLEQANGILSDSFVNTGSDICKLFGATKNDTLAEEYKDELDNLKKRLNSLLKQEDEKKSANRSEAELGDEIVGIRKQIRDITEKYESRPARLIVRDAYLINSKTKEELIKNEITLKGWTLEDWVTKLEDSDATDMPYTEVKFENAIDRIKGVADNPRQIERVPAGSQFIVEFVINVFAFDEGDAGKRQGELIKTFYQGICLLEEDYLGGHGTRGYGMVALKIDWENTNLVYAQNIEKVLNDTKVPAIKMKNGK